MNPCRIVSDPPVGDVEFAESSCAVDTTARRHVTYFTSH